MKRLKATDGPVRAAPTMRVCITGGAGFIGSHLAKRLRADGHYVVVADWKKNEFMDPSEYCDEFRHLDLRTLDACLAAVDGCEEVYHLAADMGGMGFIQSHNAQILFNNSTISCHVLEACRRSPGGVRRVFFASSACVYPEHLQADTGLGHGLREEDAWPAAPQDAYGLEKLATEELCRHYMADYGLETRVARFHNVYGPFGTWRGGREKAPAALCRKAALAGPDRPLEVWGDGEQTRSFMYIDDCVEGILRIMRSDVREPLNLGTDEMVSINALARLVLDVAQKGAVGIVHRPGPQGVRGRNSNNEKIRRLLGWEPAVPLRDGITKTYTWVAGEVKGALAQGEGPAGSATSGL